MDMREALQKILKLAESHQPSMSGPVLFDVEQIAKVALQSQPAMGSGAEPVAWRVTGPYTDCAFTHKSSADSYLSGLRKGDPDGGYSVSPLYPPPAPTAQDSKVPGRMTTRNAKALLEKYAVEVDGADISLFSMGWNECRKAMLSAAPAAQDSKVSELSASEAVYGLMGWLTSREEVTPPLSGWNNAAPGADIAAQFIDANNLSAPRDGWHNNLVHPESRSVAPSLAENPQWVRCEERMPDSTDANKDGEVWYWDSDIGTARLRKWFECEEDYTHWQPTGLQRPQPPEQTTTEDR